MPKLARTLLGILSTRAHIDDRPPVLVEAIQDTITITTVSTYRKCLMQGELSHLPRLALDPHFFRRYAVRSILSPPLERRQQPLLPILQLPLGCTHVPRDRICLLKPSFLPEVVLVLLRQGNLLRVLSSTANRNG